MLAGFAPNDQPDAGGGSIADVICWAQLEIYRTGSPSD
jgi:hypothetical protein